VIGWAFEKGVSLMRGKRPFCSIKFREKFLVYKIYFEGNLKPCS
jgi:hypothetical protein